MPLDSQDGPQARADREQSRPRADGERLAIPGDQIDGTNLMHEYDALYGQARGQRNLKFIATAATGLPMRSDGADKCHSERVLESSDRYD